MAPKVTKGEKFPLMYGEKPLTIFVLPPTFRVDLKAAGIPHRDSAGQVVHFHSFRKTHASFAARYGVAQKATQEVLGHSDANLTANIYTEMASETIDSELKKLPWITKDGIQSTPVDHAPKHALKSGAPGHLVSDPVKAVDNAESPKYLNSPMKRRILSCLDALRQNLEMVDATGLEPVTPCV